ncbi:helix-turn-helix domain-containing protein [Chitinophaga oryziterrae]|uniref:Helix-turn-helix domain-containing protein n=1 Tax=Chitinophaga oryziterrae TaxID=1031224 RepID=A0A6N8J9M9_9BACT|nr:helix-turn-helix transcriptional regulator [Chitinophaga oryziterrae]MVT41823.1 helix-turn-helix domain-containing protein [Chitinophaga oryziterrae]
MNKTETIEDFYKRKLNWVPDSLKKEIGHFNVFRIEDFVGKHARPVPYSRRDYFKISLLIGRRKIHYADKTVEIDKQALLFSNPLIPYNWESLDEQQSGYICVFTAAFFHHFGNLKDYAVFQPAGTPVLELSDEQAVRIRSIYERMYEEIESDYVHKYDALRNLVFELLHSATKMQPVRSVPNQDNNASRRISTLFLELLERQFPIEDTRQRFQLRSASDFAHQLSIHVNHLNKALKETTLKTTSDIIAERVLQEAKILLKNTHWNVSEIAYTLGFNEVTHFNNFFKKKLNITPLQFKND